MAASPREDRPGAAVLIMASAVFLFTLIDTSAKWLIMAGVPALQVVFSRYAGALLTALVFFLPRGGMGEFRSNRPWIQLTRAMALLGSTVFNFLALSYLPITLTIAMFFAIPIVTTLLSIPVLGEKVGLRRFLAVVSGFVGVLVIVQPWGAEFHWAIFFSIGALLSASIYFVLTRLLAGTDNNSTSQLWTNGVATLALVPFTFGDFVWPEAGVAMFLFLFIGFLGGVSHILATLAYRFAPASTVAPVVYVQVIYATAVGYLVFNNLPTIWTALGTAIIIVSGVYIWLRERVHEDAVDAQGDLRA
ncbi:DMT family transporter [Alisedimentitalea sp. MJ-SS2]|uniref:DMT family transporter n=1 Tax=Aliisedimentitalea sp. MJ-SS2 TaxID=3049795 RepID=UPI002915B0D3|nr:DMT family transporter [Alisedimentitalea sp. MJ-SS2]MDU8927059.1 DMT family transporter [Alisedimentitalea sp. MJ-SS2]